ncbi:hypothetical protein UlMin_012352, partial [Ulmus minor]
ELIDFYLERMVSLPLNILEDQDIHPRLCYAALRCVETLCRDWGPTIQSKYHVRILPVLAKLSCHPEHHRNQMHQAMAIIDCCHKCTPENLEPFLFAIVLKVKELCQSKSFLARAWAVSALGTVASSAQDRFTRFYETAMETLKDLLMRKYQVTRYNFKAKCLESISLIAAVIGKEKFQNDANQVNNCHVMYVYIYLLLLFFFFGNYTKLEMYWHKGYGSSSFNSKLSQVSFNKDNHLQ